MAAAPRLTPEQWAEVRKVWEGDARPGFEWTVRDMQLAITGAAVRKKASIEGWEKSKKSSADSGLRHAKAKKTKREENTAKPPAAAPRQYKRDLKGRGSVVSEPEGGEKSPPDGSKPRKPRAAAKAKPVEKPAARTVYKVAQPGTVQGSADGSGANHGSGSGVMRTLNLCDDENLWRNSLESHIGPPEEGRPSEYRSAFAHLAFEHCLLGSTDEQLAALFQVSTRTIYRWKNEHPEFCHAVNTGKRSADAAVAKGLYKRATGMVIPKIHVSNYKGEVSITNIQEYLPPDVTAARIWLFNRQPENWRAEVEPPAPDLSSRTPFAAEMDKLYDESMARSKAMAEAHRLKREQLGMFTPKGEDDIEDVYPVPMDGGAG